MEIVSALKLALADKVGQDRFELWFGAHTRLDYSDDALTVRVANQFYQDWLRTNFRQQIESACLETLDKLVPVRFLIDQALAHSPLPAKAPSTTPTAFGTVAPVSTTVSAGEARSEPRRRLATLDAFVVGPSNQLAWSAARSTCDRLGQRSPLVLYGPTSVGKTHLLAGICHDVRRTRPGAQAVYLSAEQFTTLFLDALHGSGLPSFRRKYRGLDLLIVDDLQFLSGKKATLTELLHTTDVFLREGKQLVFSADRPPNELGELGQEFTTRLQSGLVCGIELPEYDTRLGIVRGLAQQMAMPLPDEVGQFIADKIATHARELSGALNRLDATSRALGEPITLSLAEQALADTVRRHARSVKLDDIDEATLGTRPSMGHVTAREEVTSLLRQLKLPLDERGRRRAANRAEWFTQVDKPLEVHDIIGDIISA